MQDVSGSTTSRAESKAGAALLATAKLHFEDMVRGLSDMNQNEVGICMYAYRQDATNGQKKRSTLELDSGYVACAEDNDGTVSWARDSQRLKRLSDVLCIKDETASGTLGFTFKALASLGCPTWQDIATQNETLVGYKQTLAICFCLFCWKMSICVVSCHQA